MLLYHEIDESRSYEELVDLSRVWIGKINHAITAYHAADKQEKRNEAARVLLSVAEHVLKECCSNRAALDFVAPKPDGVRHTVGALASVRAPYVPCADALEEGTLPQLDIWEALPAGISDEEREAYEKRALRLMEVKPMYEAVTFAMDVAKQVRRKLTEYEDKSGKGRDWIPLAAWQSKANRKNAVNACLKICCRALESRNGKKLELIDGFQHPANLSKRGKACSYLDVFDNRYSVLSEMAQADTGRGLTENAFVPIHTALLRRWACPHLPGFPGEEAVLLATYIWRRMDELGIPDEERENAWVPIAGSPGAFGIYGDKRIAADSFLETAENEQKRDGAHQLLRFLHIDRTVQVQLTSRALRVFQKKTRAVSPSMIIARMLLEAPREGMTSFVWTPGQPDQEGNIVFMPEGDGLSGVSVPADLWASALDEKNRQTYLSFCGEKTITVTPARKAVDEYNQITHQYALGISGLASLMVAVCLYTETRKAALTDASVLILPLADEDDNAWTLDEDRKVLRIPVDVYEVLRMERKLETGKEWIDYLPDEDEIKVVLGSKDSERRCKAIADMEECSCQSKREEIKQNWEGKFEDLLNAIALTDQRPNDAVMAQLQALRDKIWIISNMNRLMLMFGEKKSKLLSTRHLMKLLEWLDTTPIGDFGNDPYLVLHLLMKNEVVHTKKVDHKDQLIWALLKGKRMADEKLYAQTVWRIARKAADYMDRIIDFKLEMQPVNMVSGLKGYKTIFLGGDTVKAIGNDSGASWWMSRVMRMILAFIYDKDGVSPPYKYRERSLERMGWSAEMWEEELCREADEELKDKDDISALRDAICMRLAGSSWQELDDWLNLPDASFDVSSVNAETLMRRQEELLSFCKGIASMPGRRIVAVPCEKKGDGFPEEFFLYIIRGNMLINQEMKTWLDDCAQPGVFVQGEGDAEHVRPEEQTSKEEEKVRMLEDEVKRLWLNRMYSVMRSNRKPQAENKSMKCALVSAEPRLIYVILAAAKYYADSNQLKIKKICTRSVQDQLKEIKNRKRDVPEDREAKPAQESEDWLGLSIRFSDLKNMQKEEVWSLKNACEYLLKVSDDEQFRKHCASLKSLSLNTSDYTEDNERINWKLNTRMRSETD